MLPPAATFLIGLLAIWLWPRLAQLWGEDSWIPAQFLQLAAQKQVHPMDDVSILSVALRAQESTVGHTPHAGRTCSLQTGIEELIAMTMHQYSVLFIITKWQDLFRN
jgi:hypothetical protein